MYADALDQHVLPVLRDDGYDAVFTVGSGPSLRGDPETVLMASR